MLALAPELNEIIGIGNRSVLVDEMGLNGSQVEQLVEQAYENEDELPMGELEPVVKQKLTEAWRNQQRLN